MAITNEDIQKVQIIATCKDGQHLIALSDDKILISCIVSWCQFMLIKNDVFSECSLKEIINQKTNK